MDSSQIVAIGVAGQMHSTVLLDEKGHVITKSILWNDSRSKVICDDFLDSYGREKYQLQTCNSLLLGFTLGKLLWLKENDPESYFRIEHVLMPKDYINFCLTGIISADVSDASGTGVFDVRNREWNETLISEIGFSRTWFPAVLESGAIIGNISKNIELKTGLNVHVLVIAGAADNAAAAVGMGVFKQGDGLVSIGTSGVVLGCLDSLPRFEQVAKQNPTLHLFCHALSGMWYTMGVTLAAGASLGG